MVDTNYIIDDFNLKGLEKTVEYYKESIYHILDYEQSGKLALRPDEVMDLSDNVKLLNREAEILYGMIHARFIVTPKGLDLMVRSVRTIRDRNSSKGTLGTVLAFCAKSS